MSSPLDLVSSALDRRALEAIGKRVDSDPETVQTGVAAALPMLLAGLARNAERPEGAASLAGALDRDHDGSVLDDVAGFFRREEAASESGAGILRHVLGPRQPTAVETVSRTSGLDLDSAARLLAMIAPIALAALGRTKRERGLDSRNLAEVLGQERERLDREQPQAMSVITQLLDQDQDGSVADEVSELGTRLLGTFFRR